MAIVIEEEKNGTSALKIITWLGILLIVIYAIYYIFFVNPPIVEVVVPPNFTNITPLVKLNLNPKQVIEGPVFSSLKPYVTVPQPDKNNAGRANPFLSF